MALAVCGGAYAVLAAVLTRRFMTGSPTTHSADLAVSMIKPLHRQTVGLAEALDSFCAQDYGGPVQLLCGVQDGGDPAATVVAALKSRRADLDIELISDARVYGANRKVSNLIHLAAAARHAILVLSDADIIVRADYLRTVVGALSQPGVGAVSCLYVGAARGGPWSTLAAMAINYHFMANAIVGQRLGLATPCFGSTIALTRETLTRIGGFEAFSDQLADDYEIGRAIRALGLQVDLPPMTVTHQCHEATFRELVGHEIRWARTVRLINPGGHAGSLLTHAFAISLIAGAFLRFSPPAIALIFAILGVRIAAKFAIDTTVAARAGPWWLLPVRDVLSFGVFLASFAGSSVDWQGRRYRVDRDGVLTSL